MKPNAPSLKRNVHDIKEIIGRKKDNSCFMTGCRGVTFNVQQSTPHHNHPLMTGKLTVKITEPKLVGC